MATACLCTWEWCDFGGEVDPVLVRTQTVQGCIFPGHSWVPRSEIGCWGPTDG